MVLWRLNIETEIQQLILLQLRDITDLQTQQGINNTDIGTLKTDIITKHPNITGTSRLNASYLGNGDVSNDKLSALNDISTVESIQTQINNVKSDLATIDGLQDLDILSIPLIQTDVTN